MSHDRSLMHRARRLRRDQTPAEARLWSELRNRRFVGYKFRRQQPIGPYIADFYCHQVQLVVELDGESHPGRGDYDRRRDAWLESQGLKVLRFFNDDLPANLDGMLECILRECRSRSLAGLGSDVGASDAAPLTPGPSPRGRGEEDSPPRHRDNHP